MVIARDIMLSADELHVEAHETLAVAARKMRDLGVTQIPVSGPEGALAGLMTDRDIVVRCIAAGGTRTPSPAGEFAGNVEHESVATTRSSTLS